MRFVTKYSLIIVAIISLASFIPHLFLVAGGQRVDRPVTFYSVVINDIAYTLTDKSGQRTFLDGSGKEYTAREHAEILPFMYYRDLEKWGVYPETINGQNITPHRASLERDFTSIYPYAIDGDRVRVKLYPLFESSSGFSTVEMPTELFRITSRMEFVDAVSNSVNEEKSVLFTEALTSAGFKFPAVMFSGNPTTKKPYDAGYFITDSNGKIFHLLQVKGQPVITDTGINPDGNVIFMSLKENENLKHYGLLVTDKGDVYHILKDGYQLKKLYLENYTPTAQTLRYIEDPLNFTLKVIDEFGEAIYVSDRNYEAVKNFYFPYERRVRGVARTVYDAVFPFNISNNPTTYGKYPQLKLSENLPAAFIFSAVLAIFYAAFRIFRNQKRARLPFEVLLILIGGIYAVLALILTDRSRED
jgi:hypothetical protein